MGQDSHGRLVLEQMAKTRLDVAAFTRRDPASSGPESSPPAPLGDKRDTLEDTPWPGAPTGMHGAQRGQTGLGARRRPGTGEARPAKPARNCTRNARGGSLPGDAEDGEIPLWEPHRKFLSLSLFPFPSPFPFSFSLCLHTGAVLCGLKGESALFPEEKGMSHWKPQGTRKDLSEEKSGTRPQRNNFQDNEGVLTEQRCGCASSNCGKEGRSQLDQGAGNTAGNPRKPRGDIGAPAAVPARTSTKLVPIPVPSQT